MNKVMEWIDVSKADDTLINECGAYSEQVLCAIKEPGNDKTFMDFAWYVGTGTFVFAGDLTIYPHETDIMTITHFMIIAEP